MGFLRCLDYFFVSSINSSEPDVLLDGRVEKKSVLRDDAQRIVETVKRKLANVVTVDTDAARVDFVKTTQKIYESCFAGAARTHERDLLSCRYLHGKIIDNGVSAVWIAE